MIKPIDFPKIEEMAYKKFKQDADEEKPKRQTRRRRKRNKEKK